MTSNKIETEAKFIISDFDTFAALQKLNRVAEFELKPLGKKTVIDRYLDTADRRLFQAGLACRLRKVQDKQMITLKALTPAAGTIHRRQEVEMAVKNGNFQVEQPRTWSQGEIKKRVVEIAGPVPLQTLFSLHQTRHQFQALWQGQPVIELSLDEVSLHDSAVVDYYELEAELIGPGSEADLTRFVAALQHNWPLLPQTQSKFERALAVTSWTAPINLEGAGLLSDTEEAALAYITSSTHEAWAKRALIILMSDNRQLSAAEIAGEVGFSTHTVRRWQKEFAQKRLAIFPAQALEAYHAVVLPENKKRSKPPKSHPEVVPSVREKIGLEPTDSLAEAGRKVLGYYFARMLKHERGTRQGKDIEALHDMRVATRRMRAALGVFKGGYSKKAIKPLLSGLKATGRALGRVRDLDVFMETLQAHQLTLPPNEQSGLQPLLETWSTQRKQARRDMLVYLDSSEYRKFKRIFSEFIKTEELEDKPLANGVPIPYQLRHVAPSLIYQHFETVHAFEVVLENASIEMLHQLRSAFKQFRYTLEYFEEILGKEREMVISDVKLLQDHLGALNDAHVAGERLRDILVKWDETQLHRPLAERPSPVHLVAYLNTRLAERQRLIVTFPRVWAHFNQPDFRHNLALAISVL